MHVRAVATAFYPWADLTFQRQTVSVTLVGRTLVSVLNTFSRYNSFPPPPKSLKPTARAAVIALFLATFIPATSEIAETHSAGCRHR